MLKLGSARAPQSPGLASSTLAAQTPAQPTRTVTHSETTPLLSLSSTAPSAARRAAPLTSAGLTHLCTRRAFLHSSFKQSPPFFFFLVTKKQQSQRSPCPSLSSSLCHSPASIYKTPRRYVTQT